jgi:glucokinase
VCRSDRPGRGAINVVGVDVGATKIAAGVVSPEGEVLSRVRYPTSNSRSTLLETLAQAISEVSADFEVAGVGLGVPGLILAQESKVIFSPNLHAIEGIPLKDELEPRVGLPVVVENDNNAAAWGEFRFGAGSGAEHLLFVGLGTGIGGGIVMDGQLLRGAQGAGGELGHVMVQATGLRCACGNRGLRIPLGVVDSWSARPLILLKVLRTRQSIRSVYAPATSDHEGRGLMRS